MVQYHKPTKKKAGGSGGKRRAGRDKRRAHWGGFFARTKYEPPKVGTADSELKESRKTFHTRGGNAKVAAEKIFYANLKTPAGVKKTRVLNVVETPANRHFARENVIVCGALLETEAGRARVTSRPGQCGVINAILVEKKEEKTKA